MRKVMAFSALCTVLGYAAVHFAFFAKPTPTPQADEPVAQADAEPVVLANVVEVTDTDALLDARPAPATGRPFDVEPNPRLRDFGGIYVGSPNVDPAPPIPPAAD